MIESVTENPTDNITRAALKNAATERYSTFFTKILKYKKVKHQQKWGDDLQDNADVVILAPACHGKTAISSTGYALWALAKNRQLRIGILTATDTLAEAILSEIKDHLEDNETLIDIFGVFKPVKPKKWNRREIVIEKESGGTWSVSKKDASITTGGALSSWKGKRLDLLIIDDFVDEKNADTPEKCAKIIKWFWETIYTRLEPNGQIKIVGTVESESDFYHDIIKNPRKFKIIHDKAIVDENAKEVLWPEHWSYEKLADIRSRDHVGFSKHFQNVVMNREAMKISTETIKKLYDASVGFYPHAIPDDVRSQFEYILMSVDPAWTRNKRSKYSVIMTVGKRHDGRRQILDIWRDQVEYDTLFTWIETKYSMLRPQYVIVETNNMQTRLEQEVRKKAIPTIASFTSITKNDLDMGIPMMYSLVTQAKIVLPTKDKICTELCEQFVNELLAWPNGVYSDVLMAYYLVEKEIKGRITTTTVSRRSAINGKITLGTRFSKRYGLRA